MTRRIKRPAVRSVITVVLYLLGFAAVIAAFPVEGMLGDALAVVGAACLWAGLAIYRSGSRTERAR